MRRIFLLKIIFILCILENCASIKPHIRLERDKNELDQLKIEKAEQCSPQRYDLIYLHIADAKLALEKGEERKAKYNLSLAEKELKILKLEVEKCKGTDTDKDGIPDFIDGDPQNSEDYDQFNDEDGIPDLDNDLDKILDELDNCPNEAEDYDEFEDEDGCPDLDNDMDEISDEKDDAPDEPEDKDDWYDEDGVPDIDNDNDMIPDQSDPNPNLYGVAKENKTIIKKEGEKKVVTPLKEGEKRNLLDINGEIKFKQGTNILLKESYKALDDIAEQLRENPSLRIIIEVHTDDKGDLEKNKTLSLKQAQAILEYLVLSGISAGRLEAVGKGAQEPYNSVEFVIK